MPLQMSRQSSVTLVRLLADELVSHFLGSRQPRSAGNFKPSKRESSVL